MAKRIGRKRRFARYRADLPLTVIVLREEGYVRVQGRVSDLAEGGLGGIIGTELVPGEVVSLEFSIPETPASLLLRAVVRYRAGFLHGFEFLGISPDQQERVCALCQNLPATE